MTPYHRRFARNGQSRHSAVLDQQKARYLALRTKRQEQELANALAYESSRLEYLESQGTPVYQPPRQQPMPSLVPSRVPILHYEEDSTTHYPFVPRVRYESVDRKHYEQDPLFGWLVDPLGFDGLYDWGLGNYGINSFPARAFSAVA